MSWVRTIAEAGVNALRGKENPSRGRTVKARRLVPHPTSVCCGLLCLSLGLTPVASAQRTALKPGWNMFSPQQDIELGKRAATDAAKQLPLCNAPKVDAYLTQLGMRLVAKLPTNGVQYPFEFHCVNDKAINAFALPGGYVFVNRGAIEAADNEAQLAGVMAHELSHVGLRHGTNQATKAEAAEGFLGIAGGIFGGSTGGALLTKLGAFAAGGVLLRYSRTAESQADVMGTQVLYDSGYDPRAMAQFFEKLESAHSRHVHIEDKAIAVTRRAGIEKCTARRKFLRFEALAFEQNPKRVPRRIIIVNDENHRYFPAHKRLVPIP